MGDQELVDRLHKVNLVEFATKFGLPIIKRPNGGVTNCIFHEDQNPSMSIYQTKSGDWLFNCFSCHEHGDIFDLVQKIEHCDFRTALEKIASFAGESLPDRSRKAKAKLSGLQVAQKYYSNQSADEKRHLKEWAVDRLFKLKTIQKFSIVYARNQKLSVSVTDREEIAALRDSDLIIQPSLPSPRQPNLVMDIPYKDAMIGERIIFPIRDQDGVTKGFLGRAFRSGVQPRYQFTQRCPKNQVLFGFDVVRKSLLTMASSQEQTDGAIDHLLYVVEGPTDVLRLHDLGINAVAVMGSNLSLDQAVLIEHLARDLDHFSNQLTIRLFFDGDKAGVSATRLALTRLLPIQAKGALFGLEVITSANEKHSYYESDPDSWLTKSNKRAARKRLDDAVVSVGRFLMSYGLQCNIQDVELQWLKSAMTRRFAAFRRVDSLLPKLEWKNIFESLGNDLFATTLPNEEEAIDSGNWSSRLTDYLCRSGSGLPQSDHEAFYYQEREPNKFIHAIQVAHCFSMRREFPVDLGSWERLLAASNISTHYLIELLKKGNDACNIEPLLGTYAPKQSGDKRLKAIPCPEQLSIQHYLLNELLSGSILSPDFEDQIPAVRFDRGVSRTTASTKSSVVPVLCFSYQVDMEIVRGEKPPGNEGFFRPYAECWSEFVDYLSVKVQSSDKEPFDNRPFHVARLDVRSYYDTLSRVAVDDILFDSLCEALKSLDEPNSFAPSFRPEINKVNERARAFVDLLCKQSFGYSYFDPSTGKVLQYNSGVSIGMPQGPSLSAYLGTIALFRLDEAVQSVIENTNSQSAYARYVDDMVLITRSKSEIDKLRAIIQNELSRVGLELSPKVEPLPPMNAVQVQNWLTSNRGLINIYGGIQTPPIVGQPIGDDGCLDRRSALVRLHDPELRSPSTGEKTLKDVIHGVLTCPEVRFSDQCHTAELVWRLVAEDIKTNQISVTAPDQIIQRYSQLWTRSSKDPEQSDGLSKWAVLAAIHGLERFLSRRNFTSTMLNADQVDKSYIWLRSIATSVQSGLVENLVKIISDSDFSLRHILNIHELNLYYLSLSLVEPKADKDRLDRFYKIAEYFPDSTNITRHIFSIASFDTLADVSRDQTPVHILFHEAIARLSNIKKVSKTDPLLPMERPIKNTLIQNDSSVLLRALSSWLPSSTDPEKELILSEDEAIRSLSVLLNLVTRDCNKILNERQPLITKALSYTSEDCSAEWLPSLPIERIDGFVGFTNTKFIAVPVTEIRDETSDSSEINSKQLSPKSDWREIPLVEKPAFFELSTASYQLLKKDIHDQPDLPRWIADSFENLVKLCVDGKECPPTVFNMLTKPVSESLKGQSPPVSDTLGFSIPANYFDAQAFIRSSNQGLVPKAVPYNGARYWRAGLAITDALGLMDEVFYDPLKSIIRPTPPPNARINEADHQWAMEKLVRFSLQRLCGRTSNSSHVQETPEIPKSIKRVLIRLRSFPVSDTETANHRKLAIVLATVFETRFAAARFENERNQDWECKSGAAVSVLVQISRRVVYTDKQLATRLPLAKSEQTGQRRNVSAWISLAARIHLLHSLIDDGVEALRAPLLGLCNGLAFAGLSDLLRCLTLETIAAEGDLRERILGLNPSSVLLADWQLDGFELFTHHQSRKQSGNDGVSELELLLKALNSGLAGDNRNQLLSLEIISPLGWAVALGIATGFLRSDLKLSFLSLDERNSKTLKLFKNICNLLKPPAHNNNINDEPDDPWSGLGLFLKDTVFKRVLSHIRELDNFGEAMGLRVSSLQSSFRFRMEPLEFDPDLTMTNRRTWEVSVHEEKFEIEPWRIASASTVNEQRNSPAENVRIQNDHGNISPKYFWTETWFKDKLVSIQVAKPGIADLAGFHLHTESDSTAEAHNPSDSENGKPDSDNSTESNKSKTGNRGCSETNTKAGSPYTEPQTKHKISRTDKVHFQNLANQQNKSWEERGKRNKHYKRIALVQWQVEEYGSYRHPIYECDATNPKSVSNRKAEDHQETIEEISHVEHRRRQLLTEVLRACKSFGVDMLLLPEYSTRPETVEWLLGQLKNQNINLIVWAGTFRFPPFYPKLSGFWSEDPPYWSSVLPVIVNQTNSQSSTNAPIQVRRKKYPSIAYGEIFNPSSSVLKAVTDVETLTTELICSEIFLASSPTNLLGLINSWNDLCQQFGGPHRTQRDGERYVISDLIQFAYETSMSSDPGKRRSILFVPAMTPRTVDYAVLGQANYLAAGLTTVFCNDSGLHSHGQSCFIGQNGWDRENCEIAGLPSPTPYHGVSPGLYRPFQAGRGWLDQNEQAMVIADVDPLYQSEGKPRPQNLMPPLKLIAHLPILEVGDFEVKENSAHGNLVKLKQPDLNKLLRLKWPNSEFWKNQPIDKVSCRRHVLSTILSLLSTHISESNVEPNTIHDNSHSKLANILHALAFAAPENSYWLKRRADAYEREHASNPMRYPPPVALDWLYVDINGGDPENTKIFVPPQRCPPFVI